jgi:hypothetical protein
LGAGCSHDNAPARDVLPSSVQPPNPCELLSTAEVASAFDPVSDGGPGSIATATNDQRNCWWFPVAKDGVGVTLGIRTDAAASAAHTGLSLEQELDACSSAIPVNGLGDVAQYCPRSQTLTVLVAHTAVILQPLDSLGPVSLDPSQPVPDVQAQLVRLARLVLGRLPGVSSSS